MKRLLVALAAGLLAAPAIASAEAASVTESPRAPQDAPTVFGIPLDSVQIGGGVQNYTGDIANQIGAGGAWDLRATLDASSVADLEVAYNGGVNPISNLGLPITYHMVTNGLGANLKLDPILLDNVVRPFVLGGIGIQRMSIPKDPALAPHFRSDTAGAIPVGAGVDVLFSKKFFASARGQYDFEFDNEVLPFQQTTNSDRWGLTVNLGLSQF